MGFFRDLFGPRQPCDICQLGQVSWPAARSAAADWHLTGGGLNAKMFICAPCFRFIQASGLQYTNPMLVLVKLVRSGAGSRPPVHAYLQRPEWRKVWLHMLEIGGISPT